MPMCPSRSSSRLVTLVVLVVFLLVGVTQAQTITGSITGTVVDSSGAIVPGSKVTVTNEATGAERTLITTENGVFIFTNLVPTTYSVKIELAGFRPVTRTALTLTSGDRVALGSIPLEVSQTSAYLAESGPNPGASIKLTTRSGTKDFHGNVYLFKRDKNFNANDFFVNRQGLGAFPYRLTTTGAAVGGPIYIPNKFNADRSKLFFFWNSEITQSFLPAGVTFNAPASVLQYQVPTLLERQGDFSQSLDTNGQLIVIKDPTTGRPFLDIKIPANRINSNGQKLLSVFTPP